METIEGDFVVISDPITNTEKEEVENLFKRIIDEKVPMKKTDMRIRSNSASTDEDWKKSENSSENSENEEEIQDIKKKSKGLFKNSFCKKIFLDHFLNYLKQKNYITLYEDKFNQLTNIFIDLCAGT